MIISGAVSDRGIKKPVNQDRIINCVFSQEDRFLFLGAIFDGISSLKESEYVADRMARAFNFWFDNIQKWIDLEMMDEDAICSHLLDTLDELSAEIYEERIKGMHNGGTTASIILITGNIYHIYHIGDSKVFLIRNYEVTQITDDQKEWGEKQGVSRFFLSNYIGRSAECEYLHYVGELKLNDSLIYGSDGFFEKTSYSELQSLVSKIKNEKDVEQVLNEQVTILKERGEQDNISVGYIGVQ